MAAISVEVIAAQLDCNLIEAQEISRLLDNAEAGDHNSIRVLLTGVKVITPRGTCSYCHTPFSRFIFLEQGVRECSTCNVIWTIATIGYNERWQHIEE